MTKRRRDHQRRMLAMIQVLEGDDALQPELGVPQADWSIDGVVRIGAQPSDGWGVLREHVADREVLVEHVRRTASLAAMARAQAKLALLVDRWHARALAERVGTRPPALLVACGGTPRSALAALPLLTAQPIVGMWAQRAGGFGDIVVLDLVHLADVPGTSVLKLMIASRNEVELAGRLDALQRDPAVLGSTRKRIVDALLTGRVPMDRQESHDLVELYRQQGRQQAVLHVLHARGLNVDEAVRERITSCADENTLLVWLQRAITATTLDEVFER